MVKGFSPHGVDAVSDPSSIDQGIKGAPDVLSDTADTEFGIRNPAFVGAETTLDPFVFQTVPQQGFSIHGYASCHRRQILPDLGCLAPKRRAAISSAQYKDQEVSKAMRNNGVAIGRSFLPLGRADTAVARYSVLDSIVSGGKR
jgi:hypothetical protein